MIWMDPNRLAFPARSDVEPRWVVAGRIEGRIWAAVFTQREAAIRIISVRMARPNEERDYDG